MKIKRLKIKQWFDWEDQKKKYQSGEIGFVDYVKISIAFGTDEKIDYEKDHWVDVLDIFHKFNEKNRPRDIPIFRQNPTGKVDELPWDYDGRGWFDFLFTISSSTGWSPDTVSNLDIDEGLSILQEAKVAEVLQKETAWYMSENSIGYDESTKKSKIIPFQRPYFMLPEIEPIKVIRMPVKFIPVGNVVKLGE